MKAIISLPRQIRKLTTNNKTGDSFGVTIPSNIAEYFSGIKFTIEVSQTTIILKSGCDRSER